MKTCYRKSISILAMLIIVITATVVPANAASTRTYYQNAGTVGNGVPKMRRNKFNVSTVSDTTSYTAKKRSWHANQHD